MSGRRHRTGPDTLSQSKQHVHTGVSPPCRLMLLPDACSSFAVSEETGGVPAAAHAVHAQKRAAAHMQGVADNAELDPVQAGKSTVLW